MTQFKDEDFEPVGGVVRETDAPYEYIRRQFILLYYIYVENKCQKKIDEIQLVNVINKRWKELLEYSGVREEFLDKYEIKIVLPPFSSEKSFIEAMAEIYECDVNNKERILEHFDKELERLKICVYTESQRKVRFAFYGMGLRGKELLNKYIELQEKDKIQWGTVGLIDKKVKKLEVHGKVHPVLQPEAMLGIQIDYVVVTSYVFFEEIKKELMGMGISEEKVLNGLWLNLL